MIEVELPDGTIVEFPDGTSQDVMRRALAGIQAPDPMQPMRDRIAAAKAGTLQVSPDRRVRQASIDYPVEQALRDPGMIGAIMAGGNQGTTFGFGDEAAAGLVSLFPDVEYDDALKFFRDYYADAKFSRPGATLAAEIGGGALAGGGLIGSVAGAGKSLAARVGLGALTGAFEGGLFGFGSGEGGFQNRAENAALNAGIGGVVGGAAPAVLAGVSALGKSVINPLVSALNIPSPTRAGNAFQTYLGRAGMTADDVAEATRRAAAEGQPQFRAADAMGNTGQRALSGVARQPGDARQMIADMLTTRQDGQGARLSSFIDDALNSPANVGKAAEQVRDGLTAARGAAADVAYDAARKGAAPVDVRDALAVIDDRIGPMAGSNVAGDGIDATLMRFRSRLAANIPPGGALSVELSDFDRVLGVKQDLQDAIGAAVRGGRNNEARELGKLYSTLDAALEAASPDYRAANDGFRRASHDIAQIDAGKAATSPRMRAEATVPQYQALQPTGQSAYRAGYADPTIARIDSAAPGVNKARPLRNDKTAAELAAMARDPELLARQIGRENTMFETGAAALGGSKTADNLADMADTTALSSSLIGNVLSGRLGAAGGQVLDRFMSGATGSNPATREIIARMLLSQDPRAMLAPAQKAAKNYGRVSDTISALIRSGARALSQ